MAAHSRSCAMLLPLLCCLLFAAQSAIAAPVSLAGACGIRGNATALNSTCVIRKTITTADSDMYQAETSKASLVVVVRFPGVTTARVLVAGQELMPIEGNRTTAVAGIIPGIGGSIEIQPTNDGLPVVYTMIVTPRTYGGALLPAHSKIIGDVFASCCTDDNLPACKSLATADDLCTDGYNVCNAKGGLTQLVMPGQLDCEKGLPPSFAGLTTLEVLDLSNSGIIQEAMGTFSLFAEMPNLEHIHLARNKLNGPLDGEGLSFFGPSNLRTVDISSNAIDGNITGVFMGLTSMEVFIAADNKLNGEVPPIPIAAAEDDSASDPVASSLQILDLSENSLTGGVTTLKNAPLMFLDLHTNNLTFPLPEASPKDLVYYDVSDNAFIPSQWLITATNLVYIDVSGNKLSGLIGGLGSLIPNTSPLRYFYAADAGIFNEIPAKLGAIPTLREVDLSGNRLSGNLNAFAAAIPANNTLLHFNVSNNALQGELSPKLAAAAMFVSTSVTPATEFSEDDRPATVPAMRIFDVSGNAAITGEFPAFIAEAAARNADADRQAGYEAIDTVVYNTVGTGITCPDNANDMRLDATGVIAIQNLGMTCFDNSSKADVGLQDALYKVVPGLPAPPPPPVKFITRPGSSKSAKTWKGVGIALGVLFAFALAACVVFAYKWRDLDLKLKQRYHKQDGDEFKQNYVVSPKAVDGSDDLENGHGNGHARNGHAVA